MASRLLTNRAAALKKQLDDYRELKALPLPDPSTIYVGDGYFVTMTLDEARAFLQKKISAIEDELLTVNQLGGVNEEGLPVFDIVEELDEEENVINTKLTRTGLGAEAGATPSRGGLASLPQDAKNKPPAVADATTAMIAEAIPRETSPPEAAESSSGSDENDDVQYIEDISACDRRKEDDSNGEFRDIDPADILELELMPDVEADDFEDVTDFDFNDMEEEDGHTFLDEDAFELAGGGDVDDDDDDDDDLEGSDELENSDDDQDGGHYGFGWKGGSLFPQDEATKRLIEAHLSKHSEPIQCEHTHSHAHQDSPCSGQHSPPKVSELSSGGADGVEGDARARQASPPKPKNHVHFAESVDVREFETTPAERKYVSPLATSPLRPMSRFKISRQVARPKPTDAAPRAPLASKPPSSVRKPMTSAAAAAAAAVKKPAPAAHVHGAVVERERGSPNTSPAKRASPLRTPPRSSPVAKGAAGSPSTRNTGSASPMRARPNDQPAEAKPRAHPAAAIKEQPKASVCAPETQPASSGEPLRGQNASPQPPATGPPAEPQGRKQNHATSTTPSPEPTHSSKKASNSDADVAEGAEGTPSATCGPLESKIDGSLKDAAPATAPATAASKVDLAAKRIFNDSFVSDEDFLRLHDTSSPDIDTLRIKEAAKPQGSTAQSASGRDAENDRPLMTAVEERHPLSDGEESDIDSDDHSNDVNMSEIKQEYQRLRQKLIYSAGGFVKKDHERAVEALEADGAPKKISRFKAARIA